MNMLEHNARAKEERRRLDFDNSWNKATAWWRALPNGVKSDYKGMNPDTLRKELERAPTKALLDCLYLKSYEKIYPHPQHYRRAMQSLAAIGPEDPVPTAADLAMIVNRPLKIRTYGFNAERAAWNWLCDSVRRPPRPM